MYDKHPQNSGLYPHRVDNRTDLAHTPIHSEAFLVPAGRPWWKSIIIKLFKVTAYSFIFCLILFGAFYVRGNYANKNDRLAWVNNIPIIGQIKQMAEGSTTPLRGEERGRINVLLLGTGGEGHAGANLTDTIMVISIDPNQNKVAMLSVPRDLSVPIENMGWRKINNVNAYAEQKQPGSGGLAASQAVSNILNAQIDYYVRVDFDGFTELIQQLGPLDVCVDNTFDDYTYPAEGQENNPSLALRYEHLHFEKGCQKMDAALALKYSRSRHAYGPEGSDFARARRQQKVIAAVKEKLVSKDTLFNPQLIANLVSSLNKHIDTNMKIWEMAKFWDLVKGVKQEEVTTKVLSNSPEGLLVDARGTDGAYLLMPRTGNFSEVQYLFKNLFSAPATLENKQLINNAKIQILNGTWINGLASKQAVDLEKMGYKIVGVANASKQDFETSVIYDLTFGQKESALKQLKNKTNANVSFNMPAWLKEDLAKNLTANKNQEHPDLVLILGTDANKAE